MCRSIHTLYHIEPAATQGEIRAAALQYVRKISGFSKPSKANESAFLSAVDDIEAISKKLITTLATDAPLRERSSIIARRD